MDDDEQISATSAPRALHELDDRAERIAAKLLSIFSDSSSEGEIRSRFLQIIREELRVEAELLESVCDKSSVLETALAASEERFRLLVGQVREYALFTIDRDGRAMSWNEGVRRVLGYEEEEFLGNPVAELIFTEEAREQRVPEKELEEAAEHGSASNDRWMMRKSGEWFWASGTTTGLRDKSGALVGFSKIMRDHTDQKAYEDRLKEKAARLAEADLRKDQFVATLAHELRNPLAPLRNAVEVLRHGGPEADRGRLCEVMDRQLQHITRLVEDLLDMSRIVQNQIVLRPKRVDMARVVRESVEGKDLSCRPAGVHIHSALPSAAVWVEGDPVRLAQIVDNLLDNACKFTPGGGDVSVELRTDGDDAELVVTDSGIGIEPDILPHIFDVFVQADRSLDRARGGLGLGLRLVQRLVELHQGSVRADSPGEGQGTTIYVRLPLAGQTPDDEKPRSPLMPSSSFQPKKIVIIEDNKDAAETLQLLLESVGHSAWGSSSGRDGLELIAKIKPDVVLCDIGLPEMDGFQVARALRENPDTKHLRLIALSGYGRQEDRLRSIESGFNAHLVKPADLDDLLSALSEPT